MAPQVMDAKMEESEAKDRLNERNCPAEVSLASDILNAKDKKLRSFQGQVELVKYLISEHEKVRMEYLFDLVLELDECNIFSRLHLWKS
jgi:hypothetical protein